MSSFDEAVERALAASARANTEQTAQDRRAAEQLARRNSLAAEIGPNAVRVALAINESGRPKPSFVAANHDILRRAISEGESRVRRPREFGKPSGQPSRVSGRRQGLNERGFAEAFRDVLNGNTFPVWNLGTKYLENTGTRDETSYRTRQHVLTGDGRLLWTTSEIGRDSFDYDPKKDVISYEQAKRSVLDVHPYTPGMANNMVYDLQELTMIQDGLAKLYVVSAPPPRTR